VFIRNRLKYALNGREVTSILMQRLVKVDNKVRTDSTFPAGFMGKLKKRNGVLCGCVRSFEIGLLIG
jgi:ribosomal protein S4E